MNQHRCNILILFFTLAVVMMGFGIVIPILPFYVEKFGASGSSLGLLMATFAVMQFIFAPIWGGISDRYGRKPVLIIGVMGNALSHLLFGLSTQLWMLLRLGRWQEFFPPQPCQLRWHTSLIAHLRKNAAAVWGY